MKWYRIDYVNEYGIERSHTFSGKRDAVQMVLDLFRIQMERVSFFSINDEEADLQHYIGGNGDV